MTSSMRNSGIQHAGFYGELFHWKTREIPFGPGITYTMLSVGDVGIGGVLKTPPGAPATGHWVAHLSVTDIQAAADKITSLGGHVLAFSPWLLRPAS